MGSRNDIDPLTNVSANDLRSIRSILFQNEVFIIRFLAKIILIKGMSTQHKIPFIFAHITSYRIYLKFGTVGQPSINSEMYRIKKLVGGEILK